jgi:hypothetical protein
MRVFVHRICQKGPHFGSAVAGEILIRQKRDESREIVAETEGCKKLKGEDYHYNK